MKSIMISIKPEWVKKILNGDKTIEIRKTMPKCELPCNAEKTTVVTKQGQTIMGHIPHWATCPKSKEFKDMNNHG